MCERMECNYELFKLADTLADNKFQYIINILVTVAILMEKYIW